MAAPSAQGNVLGTRIEGDLQVLMDVGLAETVGISVDHLRQRIDSVADLETALAVAELRQENKQLRQSLRQEMSMLGLVVSMYLKISV